MKSLPVKKMRALAILPVVTAACLAAAGCVPKPPRPVPPPPMSQPAAAPAPAPMPTPMPTVAAAPQNWLDAPQTPGDWTYRMAGGGVSEASFMTSGGAQVFTLLCSPRKQISIIRKGDGAPPMRILTETADRSLPVNSSAGQVSVTLAGSDPLLDAMAISRGRFALEVAGLPTLYLPAWPELSRVIEDCR